METTSLPGGNDPRTGEVEFVLGQRQIASLLFVAVVALSVLSTIAYVAGRNATREAVLAKAVYKTPTPATVVEAGAAKSNIGHVSPAKPPATSEPIPISSLPSNVPAPRPGEVYLQIGAVERGFAEVLIVGLRSRGMPSVMTSVPGGKCFRVLVGPLKDPAAYLQTKARLESAGLDFFPRRYEIASDSKP